MRIRSVIFFATVFIVIFGVVACGGQESQPTQVEETKEEAPAQQTEEKVVTEKKSVVSEPVTKYEDLPEELKAKLPEELKQKMQNQ